MTTIKPKTNFDRIADKVSAESGELSQRVEKQLESAEKNLGQAGQAGRDAFVAVAQAGAEIALGADKAVEGGGHAARAVGHALQGVGYAAAGVGGWVVEGAAEGVRFVAKNLARGFAGIANFFAGKDGPKVTVVEVEGDATGQRISQKMFDKAKGKFKAAGDDLGQAWNAWAESVGHAASAGGNLALAAGHVAGVAANLVEAGARYGMAAIDKVAAAGVELASLAVRAAGDGVEGARDLAILSAKFSAATANLMANAGDGKVDVQVKQQLESYGKELRHLANKHHDLRPLVAKLSFAA